MLLISFLRLLIRLAAKIRCVLFRVQKRIGNRIVVPAKQIPFLRQRINLFIQLLDFFLILRSKFLDLTSKGIFCFFRCLLQILDLLVRLLLQTRHII